MLLWRLVMLAAVTAGVLSACGGDAGEPAPTCDSEVKHYECDPSSVTYEKSVEPFATKYCITCHSEGRSGPARANAPDDVNFDTEADWLEHGGHAILEVECGRMPMGGAKPRADEIAKLDEWVTCLGLKGEHEHNHDEHEHDEN